MSDNLIYQHYTDNVAKNAVITVDVGTEDADYPATLLVDDNPAHVAKIVTSFPNPGAWVFDLGTATAVDLVGLIHHDFDAGADVRIEANASNSWGSPPLSESITIPTWRGSGVTRWPVNPWLDLSGISPNAYRYWRLSIASNSQSLELGQIWLGGTLRQLGPRNYRLGFQVNRSQPVIESLTAWKVASIYSRGTTIWSFTAELNPTDAEFADLLAQWHSCGGRTYPFLIVPDPTVNECFLVRWKTTEQQLTQTFYNFGTVTLELEEVARGVRPGN